MIAPSLVITAVVFICLMAGAVGGMWLRQALPQHHLGSDSTDVIKLVTGLMGTLAALVLSLLISSANSAHIAVKSEFQESLADIVMLDRYLADYGRETGEIRAQVRHVVARRFQAAWPWENFGPPEPGGADIEMAVEGIEKQILALSPETKTQNMFQTRALAVIGTLAQVRWVLVAQRSGDALPTPLLVVLVCWTTAIFVSFGLLTKRNPTIFVCLVIAAAAVAGAIFLILELDSPFRGLMQISSAPAHLALALLGQ
jgi:hypothetical protein